MIRGTIEVVGPSPICDIVVRDNDRRVVAAGAHHVTSALVPGIYEADVWIPGARGQQLVAVYEGTHVTVENFRLTPNSVVPLLGIQTSNDDHAALASELAAMPQHSLGFHPDGRLLLFTRTSGSPRFRPPDITLLDEAGSMLLRLDADGRVDLLNGCAGLSADLPAGNYLLAQDVPGLGPRAQMLWVAHGLETQVFLPWGDYFSDLGQAVLCMPPLGTGFEPENVERYYRAEAAVHRIVTGRRSETAEAVADGRDPITVLADAYASWGDGPAGRAELADRLLELLPTSVDAHLLALLSREYGGQGRALARLSSLPLFAAGLDLLWRLQPAERAAVVHGWAAQAISASTTGSVWTRWDLGRFPRGQGIPDSRHIAPAATVSDSEVPGTWPTRVQARQLTRASHALAAASSIQVIRGVGRHYDIGIWAVGDPPEQPPRTEIRVRVGVRVQAYLRRGENLWYGAHILPQGQSSAIELQVADGEDLIAHLERQLRLGEQT